MNTKASSALPPRQAPGGQPPPASRSAPRLDKIFICGDPHGKFEFIVRAISEYHPEAVVILGDLTPPASLDEIFKNIEPTQIYWIPGNHDTDTDLIYDRIWRSKFAKNNLHGKVLDVAGVKIAGLGGVFRGQIWMPESSPIHYSPGLYIKKVGKGMTWRGGLPRRHRSTIFCSVYDRLKDQKADVLVTHEAPSAHEKGFICIDRLAASLGVKQLFHAHQHESKKYGLIQGVATRGIGLRGIVNLAGEVIVPAEADLRPHVVYHAPAGKFKKVKHRSSFPASRYRRLFKNKAKAY